MAIYRCVVKENVDDYLSGWKKINRELLDKFWQVTLNGDSVDNRADAGNIILKEV